MRLDEIRSCNSFHGPCAVPYAEVRISASQDYGKWIAKNTLGMSRQWPH